MHSTLGTSAWNTNLRYDDNQWHLVTVVFDRTQSTAAGQTTIYVDGVSAPRVVY